MVTRVWLLRHAETATPHIFHGAESDVGLSESGERAAARLARWLAQFEPGAVISSKMRRAVATAMPIAEACHLPLQTEQYLHERRVGSLSGTPVDDPHGLWPETRQRWIEGDTAFAPPGAESFDAMLDRLLPVWECITAANVGRGIVVVAHGLVCKVLLLSLLPGWSVADWDKLGPIRNLGVSELIGGHGTWKAARLNDVVAD